MKRQHGFSVVEGLLIVVVVVIIGAVGYLAYTNLWATKKSSEAAKSATSSQPVTVNDAKDLDAVNTQLDQLSVDDSDSSQLDSASSSF